MYFTPVFSQSLMANTSLAMWPLNKSQTYVTDAFMFHIETATLCNIKLPIQWVLGDPSWAVKLLANGTSHSPPFSAKVKNEWSYTWTPPILPWHAQTQFQIKTNKCIWVIYRGAGKSLAQPGRKQATATEDILMFIYPIYYHNWRNISTIYIYIYNKTSIKWNILITKLNTLGSRSG